MTNTVSKSKDVNEFEEVDKEIEKQAMNIVFQIGDALSEAKAPDFVGKRQETNDMCIDFVYKFLAEAEKRGEEREREKFTEKIKALMMMFEHFFPGEDKNTIIVCETCREQVKSGTPCINSPHYPCWCALKDILDSLTHQKG